MTADNDPQGQQGGIDLNTILFIVFRHRRKILACTLFGLLAAAATFLLWERQYESRTKLLVRYVLERSAIDGIEAPAKQASSYGENLINSEVEILTSWDLALEVADAVGVNRLLKRREPEPLTAAASGILENLEVTSTKGNNVIVVSYKNKDPEVAKRVLEELVSRYFDKHLHVHRSIGAFDFVSEQTEQVHSRLRQTEDELKRLKTDAGVISLAETTASLSIQTAKSQEELLMAEAELVEQKAKVTEMERWLGNAQTQQEQAQNQSIYQRLASTPGASTSVARPNGKRLAVAGTSEGITSAARGVAPQSEDILHYRTVLGRLERLRDVELALASKYTAENPIVKLNKSQIAALDQERSDLERRFPSLASSISAPEVRQLTQTDLIAERARLAAVDAKVEKLKAQVHDLQNRARQLSDVAPDITELERKKEVEEANYKYFESSLEKARIDEALDPSKIPNISVVQKPSPAEAVVGSEMRKILILLSGGGIALGLIAAFAFELLFNRTVKRTYDLERMKIPVLFSIPLLQQPPRARARLGVGGSNPVRSGDNSWDVSVRKEPGMCLLEVAPWDSTHFLRKHIEAVRDRLLLYFQLRSMTHKPKLVAVTGASKGAGASTLAAGLAAAFSETGDEKVLFVDMHAGRESSHPFFSGSPALPLADALKANGSLAPAAENLYLATARTSGDEDAALLPPQRFYDLVPNLKASQYDYIIFDMPSVEESSASVAMASSMDKVLLVIESDESNQQVVKRIYLELVAAKADVSAVFNKTRSPGPKWLALES